MNECWINVYNYNGEQWLGIARDRPLRSGSWTRWLVYRIHVRLK